MNGHSGCASHCCSCRYRDSKLTLLLKNSLEGNALVVMIAVGYYIRSKRIPAHAQLKRRYLMLWFVCVKYGLGTSLGHRPFRGGTILLSIITIIIIVIIIIIIKWIITIAPPTESCSCFCFLLLFNLHSNAVSWFDHRSAEQIVLFIMLHLTLRHTTTLIIRSSTPTVPKRLWCSPRPSRSSPASSTSNTRNVVSRSRNPSNRK